MVVPREMVQLDDDASSNSDHRPEAPAQGALQLSGRATGGEHGPALVLVGERAGWCVLLEKGAKAAGNLPHGLRVRQGKALVADESFSIEQDMKEISGIGTLS